MNTTNAAVSGTKIAVTKEQFKIVTDYLYRPEVHGSYIEFREAMEEKFDIEGMHQGVKVRPPTAWRDRNRPVNRKCVDAKVTVHRRTPTSRALCLTKSWDITATEDDSLVTCANCKKPKNQEKLRRQSSSSSESQSGHT